LLDPPRDFYLLQVRAGVAPSSWRVLEVRDAVGKRYREKRKTQGDGRGEEGWRVVSFFVRDLSHEKTGVPREAPRNRLRHNFPCTDLYWFSPPDAHGILKFLDDDLFRGVPKRATSLTYSDDRRR